MKKQAVSAAPASTIEYDAALDAEREFKKFLCIEETIKNVVEDAKIDEVTTEWKVIQTVLEAIRDLSNTCKKIENEARKSQ